MRIQTMPFTALLILVAASLSFADRVQAASEIYKWTDQNGNVIYGDRPIGTASERVDINSSPTNNANIQATAQARTASRQLVSLAAEKVAPEPTAEEKRAEATERAASCSKHRATLEKFSVSRRLYREDENGERVYLDETDTQDARDRAENRVQEFCS